MKKIILFYSIISACLISNAQVYTSKITGTVTDKQSHATFPGVNVVVLNPGTNIGTITDKNGNFVLNKVPVGRVDLKFSFVGYEPVVMRNLLVVSGRSLQVNVEMQENIQELKEVVVRAHSKENPINEMATVSARSFTIEETERYAGSLGDPARMVSNYAGVVAASDQRNDIIIRGNSPLGLLWRLEGMDIPNPNHFGTLGTTGGAISILNNNQLANSDFYTSAFPAEYGNAISGVFDLKMRNGNFNDREYLAQMGFNGFELGMEGPFSKKSTASYLFNYRYSFLDIMHALGIFNIGGVPEYQDLSGKIFLPTKKLGTFSLITVGGKSHIKLEANSNSGWTAQVPGDTRVYSGSNMGVVGLTHKYFFSNKAHLESALYVTGSRSFNNVDTLKNGNYTKFYQDNYYEIKYALSTSYNKKINSKNTFKTGISAERYDMNYYDETRNFALNIFYHLTNTKDNTTLLQGYVEWKHRFTEQLSATAGLHEQLLTLNNDNAFEPRAGIEWNFAKKQILSAGYGLQSQMQPRLIYFTQTLIDTTNLRYIQTNRNLKFSKSNQFVLGYHILFTQNLHLKLEAYYQSLFDIPVEQNPSYFSVVNYGASFYNQKVDSLVNKGVGKNYGLELTFEKFLSNHFYFLLTGSLFESKYRGSDGVWRLSAFDGNYAMNFLTGYEIPLGNNMLSLDIKTTWAGGKRYVPIDLNKSRIAEKAVFDYADAYNERFPAYFRMDLRLAFKLNSRHISQEWTFDVENLTNYSNIYTQQYDVSSGEITYTYQTKFFPIGSWRIYF